MDRKEKKMSATKTHHHDTIERGMSLARKHIGQMNQEIDLLKKHLTNYALSNGPTDQYHAARSFLSEIEKNQNNEPVDVLFNNWLSSKHENSLKFLLKAVGFDGNNLIHVLAFEILKKIGGEI